MARNPDPSTADSRNICPACNAIYDAAVLVCDRCGTGLLEIPDAPILSGTTLDLRYDIEGVVGTGGMGTVYRARQRGMEREVAIKVLHPRYAHEPRAVKRFFREAQAASRLIHPHVVTVYDFGRSVEGHLYMVMELLEGMTLGDLIHYRAPLAPALALAIVSQVADALSEAHRQRLVHRDLKPDNIILTSTEDGLWAKVLDFGIARIVREPGDPKGLDNRHSTVEIAGTPAYMSPEQILGKEPDPRSDLYSLGIILFEMLTRQRPFDDPSSVALCMKQLSEPAPRVGTFQQVSEPLERLVASLLAKQPEERPARATDLEAIVQRCPESSFPFSVPSTEVVPGAPRGLGQKTTRAELAQVPDKTVQMEPSFGVEVPRGGIARGQTEVQPRGTSQGEAFARAADSAQGTATTRSEAAERKTRGPEPTALMGASALQRVDAKKVAPYVSGGRSMSDVAAPRAATAKAPLAVAMIVAEHPGALTSGELARWLVQKEGEGLEVVREDRRALVKVAGDERREASLPSGPKAGRNQAGVELVQAFAADLLALQTRALAANLGLRIGLAAVEAPSQVTQAIDLARRIAVATTHGQVAVPATLAGRAGLAVRPQTTVFLPDGQSLECAVLRRVATPARAQGPGTPPAARFNGGGAVAGRPVAEPLREDGDDADLGEAGLLWGRGLQLRRLGQIGDESMRHGPTMALVQGARGMGKSALVQAFINGRNALAVRVSPAATASPGHALASLVAAAYRLPAPRGKVSDLDSLVHHDLGDRERELLELLLLDRPAIEPPTLRALARLVFDALSRRAGEGPLVIVMDDVHFLDRASKDVLQLVVKLAQSQSRPWCFVATARVVKPETMLADQARIELRPLGLRAMNQLAESLKVAPRQRHALLAAAAGNPLALRMLARMTEGQEVPLQLHQLGEGCLAWLLTGLLRGADPRDAERAWLEAALGEGPLAEDALTQAARMHLEKELPKDLAAWVSDRLARLGPATDALAQAFREPSVEDATRRAGRHERLGLFRLAALEVEAALPLSPQNERGSRELEIASLRAKAGDLSGAIQSFDASARSGGERRPTALLRFARTLLGLGDSERAAQALDLVQSSLEESGAAKDLKHAKTTGEWFVLKAKAALVRGDLSGTGGCLQRARDLADAMARSDARGARGLSALVQEARAELALATGDREAARTNFRQARDAFRDLGLTGDALRCLVALGEVELEVRDLKRATDTFRAASRLAATAGLHREELMAEVGLGEAELLSGELDEGSTRLRAALRRVSAEDAEEVLIARVSLGMARAMVARRLWADVFRYAERARANSRSASIAARSFLAEAEAHVGLGEPRRAQKSLQEAHEAARASVDALLMERVRQARVELERLGPSELHA